MPYLLEMKNITNEQTNVSKGDQPSGNQVNIQNAQVFLGGPADLMEQEGDAFDAKQVVAEQ